MRAMLKPSGAVLAAMIECWTCGVYAQENKLSIPNVTVTAPAVPVQPPYLRNPWKSYERNPYAGRYRVEEDKFSEVPCNVTRIASSTGGKCLQGYRLVPGNAMTYSSGGLNCDMALDVVMYSAGNLAIEASTLIFDPYKLVATGLPNKWCYVRSHPTYDQEDFQDMNQVTRRGTNWRNLVSSGEEDMGRTIASPFTSPGRRGVEVMSTCCTPASAGPTRPRCAPKMSPTRYGCCKFANTTRKATCARPAARASS
jgi:hypothetical protein